MPNPTIAHARLHNQHIAGPPLDTPAEVVRRLGAVQAQDYLAAQWALGLRLQSARDTDIDRALAEGSILRTHVLRPTWHFVTPDDIRWLLALTAPRVHALNDHYYRKSELDDALLRRSDEVLAHALIGGKQLTRAELAAALQQAGIDTQAELRLGLIVMHAELEGIICSGPRRGKQFTYALLAERAPHARTLTRDESLAELATRYFTGHGPATLKDYVWWSGLTAADAQAGIRLAGPHLIREVIDGQTYWRAESAPVVPDPSPVAYLLPCYDEFGVGYADRSAVFDAAHTEQITPRGPVYFGYMLVLDGQIVGAWKRTLNKASVAVAVRTYDELTAAESEAVARAAHRYGAFLGLPVVLA